MCSRCRRKTLLWLDDHPDNAENVRIRRSIPGAARCEPQQTELPGCLSLPTDNTEVRLEDQVSVTLFTAVGAICDYLSKNVFLAQYPSSLFRIVSNRRLFVGEGGGGLSEFLDTHPDWANKYPATCVFHGKESSGLRVRPNFIHTQREDDCSTFVSFGTSGAALQ